MTTRVQVALLGATGKAGNYILKQLIHQGYAVKALIRKPHEFTYTHPLLQIIPGDIKDPETANLLIEDCSVVISAIGQKPGEPLISALSAQHIISAMNQHRVMRYLYLAGLTVDVTGDNKSEANQAKTNWMRETYPDVVADKQMAYALVANSNLNWTMVRLPWIEPTTDRRQLSVNLHDSPGEVISTADLAVFVVQHLSNHTYFKQAPFVASL